MSDVLLPRILIVDDNPSIHLDFRKSFGCDQEAEEKALHELEALEADLFDDVEVSAPKTSARFQIDSANQGQEALEMVERALEEGRPYSLAFMDVRMPPGWDGIETTSRIWKVQPDLQVVICSAYSDYSWEQIFEALDTTDRMLILKKPFQRIEVLQMAQALTRKWTLSRELEDRMNSLETKVAERTATLKKANQQLLDEISERERMEAQLIQAQKLEAIGQLSAGIAHEINTPIQYIGDNVNFLADSFEEIMEIVRNYVDLIEKVSAGVPVEKLKVGSGALVSKRQAQDIVEDVPSAIDDSLEGLKQVADILGAMKVFSHIGPEDKCEMNLKEAIDCTLAVAKNEWKNCARIVVDIPDDLGPLPCFAREIKQAFLNLVINAAHAIAERKADDPELDGVISVSAERIGDSVVIEIGDTGNGVPDEIRERIFEPFFTTKEVGKGTGQGLSMVYACIVNRHNGEVGLRSKSGEGSVFSLKLPLSD